MTSTSSALTNTKQSINNNIQHKQQNNYRNRISANGQSNKSNIQQSSNLINTSTNNNRLFNRNNNKRRCISPLNQQKQTILIEEQSATTNTQQQTIFNSSNNIFNNSGNIGITNGNNNNCNTNELIGAVLEKITSMPNGFAFNPFICLQQLNGVFPTFNSNNNNAQSLNNNNNQSQLSIKNITNDNNNEIINFKNKEHIENLFCGINNNNNSSYEKQQQPQEMLLEECLSISQKFLKEINDEEMILNNSSKNNLNNNEQINEKKINGNYEEEEEEKQINNNNNGSIYHHSLSSTISSPFNNLITTYKNNNIYSEDPLYFPQNNNLFKILEGSGLDKTIFNTFSSSNEIIEKFDLSIFETLLEQQSINSNSLLTPTQKKRVGDIRSQLGLQTFEIMFALHRLDSNILKPLHINLVQLIAPTKCDIRRFSLFEQQYLNNSNNGNYLFDKDEQFIIELSKIERLREKLALMAFIGEFNDRSIQLNKKIQCISSAATLLNNSPHFHILLHLLLIAINLINGDFTIKLIKAFSLLNLQKICSFNFPNGFNLLQILAKIVIKYYPELIIFIKKSKIVEEASKINFIQLVKELNLLEKGQSLVEEELIYLTEENTNINNGNNQQKQQLNNFSANSTIEIVQLKESLQSL
ncbi:FH2 domain-containing protein, partial [Meloidogyne graminicola]